MSRIDDLIAEAVRPGGVEAMHGGGTVLTGHGITRFQVAQLRGVLKLEAAGMRRRGTSAVSQARALGLRGRSASALLADLDARLAAAIADGGQRGTR